MNTVMTETGSVCSRSMVLHRTPMNHKRTRTIGLEALACFREISGEITSEKTLNALDKGFTFGARSAETVSNDDSFERSR